MILSSPMSGWALDKKSEHLFLKEPYRANKSILGRLSKQESKDLSNIWTFVFLIALSWKLLDCKQKSFGNFFEELCKFINFQCFVRIHWARSFEQSGLQSGVQYGLKLVVQLVVQSVIQSVIKDPPLRWLLNTY